MFSSSNNSTSTQETWRVFGRLTQKFGTEESNSEKSSSLIKNAYITIQGDYTSNYYQTYDERHKYNLFDYGHVGTFTTYKRPVYQNGVAIDSITGIPYSGSILVGWQDTFMNLMDLQLIIQTRIIPKHTMISMTIWNVFSIYFWI